MIKPGGAANSGQSNGKTACLKPLNIVLYGKQNRSITLVDRLLPLLRQKANVRHGVLHFSVGELAAPGMHRAEDHTMFDGSQQLFIGFQERPEALKIGRWHFQGSGGRSIASTARSMAALTIPLVHGFPARMVWRIVLGVYGGQQRQAKWSEKNAQRVQKVRPARPQREKGGGVPSGVR